MMKISKSLLYLASIASGTLAAKRPFSIHDDVLAYPQYKVSFPEEYVLETEASIILELQKERSSKDTSSSNIVSDKRDLERHASQRPIGGWKTTSKKNGADLDWDPELSLNQFSYEEMKLEGLRYLCNIPRVNNGPENSTTTKTMAEGDGARNQTQDENEIARATDRGLELLEEMEGTCMYYVSGWWSYSFCYKKQVKQFHAKSGPGVPNYPPIEDPTSHSFVLGKFLHDDDEESERYSTSSQKPANGSTAELQTKGESRYLVQKLGGGTICDLTGAERKIEVQFHCHPQSTDRIGWIKELTTCSYLMVIYTPRLCHDVAFQLPQFEETHLIQCREILAPEEIADFDAMKAHHDKQKLVDASTEESQFVGGIEVGAKKEVGSEGKVIEKGRMARIGEETVQVIAKREDGNLVQLSNKDLKKYNLNPKEVENFANQLDEKSKGGDWRLEIVESNGETSYRAIISSSGDEDDEGHGDGEKKNEETASEDQPPPAKKAKEDENTPKDEDKGSEETYKDEL
ncbi:misfolded glycoproteins degradation protein Yos9, putative [Talaromyces stipitatus ATCC 10500]|uniref:Endoplasmic reticulum lectin n=1 Tax=Talaromyces stipitatus (strain ATCC 10500 / CBS 375.48 / QM 6759 / NRRL 1006) TaxID=441959 RepID=B8ME08_TALSN|nr:misfolded glycoproteins degradation protein Yos9, putative [Talaromyces stipitatus ATCC 10500]EED16085.1 misfolded glycoproteins degradation protein Yos9, putative [Talaromyces stipitatus ATCC 10500]